MLASPILTGYDLTEIIHEGAHTIIYRGTAQLNAQPVILKILKADYPTLDDIARLKHEYKMTENLDIEGIVKFLRLETHQNRLVLVCEDFGGQSLKQLLSHQKLDMSTFLSIALQLAQALVSLHNNRLIHKDIKPANIIINQLSGQVKLTDFSISSRLYKETPPLVNPNQLEGTLAYMSPEQTGRMNRPVDYRSDFYSLGITFYEILTGQLPFQSNDPLELVHCHLAKQPLAIKELKPEVPPAICSIVMKLMHKNAEDRYQSAAGLVADLELCQNQLNKLNEITEFIPGRLDVLSQLLIPQKLYGRETQVHLLLSAFERVSQGSTELMLVSGYSGIGKSSIVNEVNKPITRSKGYFVSGKFDQFKRDIPYISLIQAFSSLMQQLLTESAAQIDVWKGQILSAVGLNGQVIIDVIPEVELIIGSQPEVPQLGGTETQNRFNRVFSEFTRVFAQKEHPLVIFLDDLQWADSATLKLTQLLITDPDSKYLLVIGAYRDNEVKAGHILKQTIEEIENTDIFINNIVLQPLTITNVIQLITETLHDNTERSYGLAELIFNKTGGNPFFLTQLLQVLYQDKLLKFDFITASWQWSIAEIQAIGITDKSIVELVSSRIQRLPEETQEVLKLAACIGDKFTLDVLSIVNEQSPGSTANQLYAALEAGLILPLSEAYRIPLVFSQEEAVNLTFDTKRVGYKFLHDRVQQAAYSLIPQNQQQITHLKIGQLLLKQTPPEVLVENVLDIVNQLNIGVDLLANQAEKNELAKLNLLAGKKAKTSNAYEAAIKYLNLGLNLLVVNSWQSNYELMLNLHRETAEVEYLHGNFERSRKIANITLQQANNILDKVKVYEIEIQSYTAQNRLQEALDIGVKVLTVLGVRLPKKPKKLDVLTAVIKTKLTLTGKRIEDLAALPQMTDPYKLAAMQILMLITPAASQSGSLQFPLAIMAMVRLSVKYNNSTFAAFGYSFYGAMLCDKLGDIEAGYRFGWLGLAVLDKMKDKSLRCKVLFVFNSMIRHFKDPLKETIISLQEGIQMGLETGDIEFASYCTTALSFHLLSSGENREIVEHKLLDSVDLMRQLKLEPTALAIRCLRQCSLNFLGRSLDKTILVGDAFNETEMISVFEGNYSWLSALYICKTILYYLFQDYKKAIQSAKLTTEKYQDNNPAFLMYLVNNFYYSLALLAEFKNTSSSEQKQYLKQVALNQKNMKKWAYHAPCNYRHKYELIEAEKARVLGQDVQAMLLYDRAISGAAENGYIQEVALANELAAEFYLALGKEKIAKTYMTEAYYSYNSWGAIAKVHDLEERYPELIIRSDKVTESDVNISSTISRNTRTTKTGSTTSSGQILDMATVMKLSQAISSEIVLDKLLGKLLAIILENAAAQKGCLILEKDKKLFIEVIHSDQNSSFVVLQSTPVETSQDIPITLVNYVARTQQTLVIGDASSDLLFREDPYIKEHQPKSVVCAPIFYQGKFTGIFYLENNLATEAFTKNRLEILKLLTSQAAIAIENARLYSREQERSQQLQQSLQQLQQTQAQLVQTEKISSLGQLVAGVAHEVNNPVSFISGNLSHVTQYVEDLINLLDLYQKNLPSPPAEIADEIEAIDLEFLLQDLPKMISSMKVGTERIRGIMQSLRTFSRTDSVDKKAVDIHEGIETTLMILQHRLKASPTRPAIQVVKEYSNLSLVGCYPGQMNQVFMNLLANAIDALEESNNGRPFADIEKNPNMITIHTETLGDQVMISITDNGSGMPEEVRQRLFDAFFTTKPEGKGTGLGLSISYQIVTEKHGGKLQCISSPGKGAEFVIQIPL
ncbi:trifunctional serine/threonine-protein kinase/ATP-binding protein/sensor histidine kinase [Cylindrospermum sp. FACHB-282]|uniref:trifunctional serine/threonine-protein kinase/ATP-binding protein/sensor histidine kinase n=1 Tax=Cylindrospermum sp. FACHB-282 TaxID=2692794 RepID=UPI001689DF6F|nr:ATP-binding sensor histidine kinase [Cylindrospermum sp. FACHB-282]MBD2387666.1 AAA family ATPase [Cylindrospermum sp. FACHB-282]